jgi:hypothetical protein
MEDSAGTTTNGWLKVVVCFNPATAEFSLTGCDENPVVVLGMLDYALARVRRGLTTGDIQREMQNASRIQVSQRIVS